MVAILVVPGPGGVSPNGRRLVQTGLDQAEDLARKTETLFWSTVGSAHAGL